MRQRRAGIDPIPLLLRRVLLVGMAATVTSLPLDPFLAGERWPILVAAKSFIALTFGVASLLALRWRRVAVGLTLTSTMAALCAAAIAMGPSVLGAMQLASTFVVPLVVGAATVGNVSASVFAAIAAPVASQVVVHAWGLPMADRLMTAFVAALFGAMAIISSVILTELAKQGRHDQRVAERAGRRLARAQRLHALAERRQTLFHLSASVAHEINNPLAFTVANVRYVTEVLKSGNPPDTAEVLDALNESLEGLARIEAVVQRMRALRVMQSSENPTNDARRTVVEALQYAGSPGIQVVIDVASDLPPLVLDPLRLADVVRAVVTNAVEACTAAGPPRTVRVSSHLRPSQAELIVEDDGPGFGPTVISTLFVERAGPARPGGKLGLSLTLAREVMRSVGGDVSATNRSTGGARVVIECPVLMSR